MGKPEEDDCHVGETSREEWFWSAIGWDGFLPVAIASYPAIVCLAFPGNPAANFLMVVWVPIIAALFRAHHGYYQIEKRVGGRASLGRQFFLGCAIILLLVFESLSAALHGAAGAPPSVWLVAGVVYLCYLALTMIALRPARVVKPIESQSLAEVGWPAGPR